MTATAVQAQENEDTCPVCVDGTTPSITFQQEPTLVRQSLNCNNIVRSAGNITDPTSSDCQWVQLAAFQGGCCDNFITDRCTLCPNGGTALNSWKEIPMSSSPSVVDCEGLETNETVQYEFLKSYHTTPGICESTRLRRSAGWCGCEDVAIECDMCNGMLFEPNKEHVLTGITCYELAYELSLLTADECPNAADQIGGFDPSALCCGVPPPNTCPLCAASQEVIPDRILTTPSYGDVTCADLQEAATLIPTDDSCQSLRSETAGLCCLNLPEPGTMPLCEFQCPDTGLPPPDLMKRDPVTGHSCDSLSTAYRQLNQDQCLDAVSILGFDAPAFCCPGVAPILRPAECTLCPQGERLLYPHRVLYAVDNEQTTTTTTTCGAIEEALTFAAVKGCHALLDESRALRNCPCREDSAPFPPTMTPGGTNGVEDQGGISAGASDRSISTTSLVVGLVLSVVLWNNQG
jgi:hypothetical protein